MQHKFFKKQKTKTKQRFISAEPFRYLIYVKFEPHVA